DGATIVHVTRLVCLALAAAALAGCAPTVDPDLRRDDACIYEIGSPHAVGGDYQLYKAHNRVPGDDLIAATADVNDARMFASKAQLDEWLGIGSLVLGPVLFLPGVGLLGYGIAKGQDGSIAGGTILSVTGAAGIIAGAYLYHRSDRERARAIDLYNHERAASCRP
ncbi:MAG TPA: hypothetical protein VF334_09065, partial [Polyangia bacterium]